MAATKIKGRGVVYGSDGQVVMAGLTTITMVNTVKSAEASDASEMQEAKDSSGKVRTLIVPEVKTALKFTMTPGGTTASAATLAEAVAQSVLIRKMDTLTTTLFAAAAFNVTNATITGSSVKISSEGNLEYDIDVMVYETVFSGAALS